MAKAIAMPVAKAKTIAKAMPIAAAIAIAATSLLLASCDKESEDAGSNTPVPARITSVIDGMSTRASGTAWAPGDRIGITATKADGTLLLDNAPYITTHGNGTFTPEGDEFYFQDGDDVTFTAYYPFTKNSEIANDGKIVFLTSGSEIQKPENQPKIDYMFATATGSSATPDLKLKFRHCMSRFVLRFLPGTGVSSLDDISYELTGVKTGGTFNTLTGEADVTGNNTVRTITLTVPGSNASELTSPLIIFPQQHDAILFLTLTLRGERYAANFFLPRNPANNNVRELLPGHSYTYNIKVHNNGLTIAPAGIAGWGNGGSEDINSTTN